VAGDAEALSRQTGAVFPVPLVAPPLFDDHMVDIRDMLARGDGREEDAVWLMIERASRRPVGIAGINIGPTSGTALTGYAVYPDQQGKGFTTEAMRGLVAWLFATTEVAVLQATIPPSNLASVRVAEKLGMEARGTAEDPEAGEVVVYELRKTDLTNRG
jgi:ribosomal-protein-alanine N-acetyltransferase